eukprot:TRINITY_DN45457_c0_g1_i1.p1 TRINITY_DN45457_c0_g1~~TRINITY_DN45457_c0_g1_i1.p1  ORF type:complete len:185 (+),score=15.47 TRINITY_DN45457_c0_g1_i1:2-556(+)
MTKRSRSLADTRLSTAYRQQLNLAHVALCDFFKFRGLKIPGESDLNVEYTNKLLVKFIQHLYETDGFIHVAKYCILSLQNKFRQLKGQLREAWDSYESWSDEQLTSLRPPLPLLILTALCYSARLRALAVRGLEGLEWFFLSIMCMVGFYGLLRPGELLSLKRKDIALPSDGLFGVVEYAVVSL